MKKILILKLGALGDFIMAQPAIAAIRAHHLHDELCLLTIPSLTDLARASSLFERILEDPRTPGWRGCWNVVQRLRREHFDFVYDLQGTTRTAWYWRLLWSRRPQWAGPVTGCSHPRPPRPAGAHRTAWYSAQLAALGITVPPAGDLSWLTTDLTGMPVPTRCALIVAGGSAHRVAKRWPVQSYIALARELVRRAITPLLIGTQIDAEINAAIGRAVPEARDFTNQTTLAVLASLARRAVGALGNDTGPMHVIAAVGCPSVVLFSAASDPTFIAPRGLRVQTLQRPDLAALSVADVERAVVPCWRLEPRNGSSTA